MSAHQPAHRVLTTRCPLAALALVGHRRREGRRMAARTPLLHRHPLARRTADPLTQISRDRLSDDHAASRSRNSGCGTCNTHKYKCHVRTQVQVAACTLVRQHTRRTHFTRQRQHRHCAPPRVWTRLSEPASKPTSLPPHPPAGPLLNQRRAPPAAPYTSASDLPPPLLPSPAVCARRIT